MNGKVYAGDGSTDLQEAVAVRATRCCAWGRTTTCAGCARADRRHRHNGGAVIPVSTTRTHFISGGLRSIRRASRSHDARCGEGHGPRLGRTHPNANGFSAAAVTSRSRGGLPSRRLLDTLVPDRPAYLIAYDGHTGWANTKALKAAGISRRTPNPLNGVVMKDPRSGEPTGVLKEAAMALMARVAPQPTREDKLAAIRAGLEEAHRLGVTSVIDVGGGFHNYPDDYKAVAALARR